MKLTALSPAEIDDLSGLLYAALRPGPRRISGVPVSRLRTLLRRVRAAGRAPSLRRAG